MQPSILMQISSTIKQKFNKTKTLANLLIYFFKLKIKNSNKRTNNNEKIKSKTHQSWTKMKFKKNFLNCWFQVSKHKRWLFGRLFCYCCLLIFCIWNGIKCCTGGLLSSTWDRLEEETGWYSPLMPVILDDWPIIKSTSYDRQKNRRSTNSTPRISTHGFAK